MFGRQSLKEEERAAEQDLSTATLAGIDDRSDLRTGTYEKADSTKLVDARYDDAAMNKTEPINTRQTIVDAEPVRQPLSTASVAAAATNRPVQNATEEENTPLFPTTEATDFRGRWDAIQVGFVDEPRRAVEQADALVAGAMKRMAEIFAEERAQLEGQWDRGDNVSTEDLRIALRRYRSFFGRVLAV